MPANVLALSVKPYRACQLSQRESPWHSGKVTGLSAKWAVSPEPLPLGEVASRSDDGEGEPANRSAALSQKAALQMPFPFTTPPVKMRLERSAERDKREIINNSSAEDG